MGDYCVKCKKKTDNTGESIATTKNNRKMRKSTCAVCNTRKTTFIKS